MGYNIIMAKIDVAKKLVDDIATEDIINLVLNLHIGAKSKMRLAEEQQNLAYMGEAKISYEWAEQVLSALYEKMNGKKIPTVL